MSAAQFDSYEPPYLAWKFPFGVGDSWSSQSNVVISGYAEATGTLALTSRVVSMNSIRVPAGDYVKCYLIQDRSQEVISDGTSYSWISYTWFVPGVGIVASISSANGEIYDVFTQASKIERLKTIQKTGTSSADLSQHATSSMNSDNRTWQRKALTRSAFEHLSNTWEARDTL